MNLRTMGENIVAEIPVYVKRYRFILIAFLVVTFFLPLLATAQQSRAEEIARKKAEKAKQLRSYAPSKAETVIERLTAPRRGFYPHFGSVFSGGGIAAGPGYWKPYGDNAILDIHSEWSVENYRSAELYTKFPDLIAGSFRSELKAKYIDAGHVSFYGLGNETQKEDETNFGYRPTTITLTEIYKTGKWLSVGGGIEYMLNDTAPGDSGSLPSTEEVFTPATAPGLGTDPEYFNTSLFATFDWRQSPGYTTSGGYYRFDFKNYDHTNGNDDFNFRRYDIELDQYLPLFRANQILAFRTLLSFTEVNSGNVVPFFLTPRLGGSRDLRGFRSFRFRDRHRLLLTAEYRWTPSKFMDLLLFYEVGKVASETGDLDFDNLQDCYGFGARFHAPYATILRFELAHSSETTRLIVDTGIVF